MITVDRIASYWDKQSAIWRQEKEEAWTRPETERWLVFFKSLLPKLQGNKALEIGTASGYFANIMVEAGFNVVAVDLSPDMIEEAKQVSHALELPVDYQVMDAQNLAFADKQYDLIFTRLMTWTIPDVNKCYQEAFRVLKKDGMFLNFDGDFGKTVFSQEGHERYPAEIMEEANIIKSELDISGHKRPEKDLEILANVGFATTRVVLQAQNQILATPEDNDSSLFMLEAIK